MTMSNRSICTVFSMIFLVSVIFTAPQTRASGRETLFQPEARKSYGLFVQELLENEDGAPATKNSHKPIKAAIFSALIPGSGQIYNRTYIRAGIYLAIEAASIYYAIDQNKKGDRLDANFKAYADQYWHPERYWNALADESGCDINDTACLKEWERDHFSHYLPDTKNQTYYENIGKYDQFNIGWEDATEHRGRDSALREAYTYMRRDSNNAYENARLATTILIINHIVSAAEAAYTAHRRQSKGAHAALNLEPQQYGKKIIPALAMRVTW